MEYVKIAGTNISSSRIGLGCWAIGGWLWGGSEERESVDTILAALGRGINLIDTAAIYGFGRSEEIVGKALSEYGQRDKVVIATKVGLDWTSGKVYRDSTRDRIMIEVEDSLKRLRTDYIDIYQIHWPDSHTPIEETASVMDELLKAGKIRAIIRPHRWTSSGVRPRSTSLNPRITCSREASRTTSCPIAIQTKSQCFCMELYAEGC